MPEIPTGRRPRRAHVAAVCLALAGLMTPGSEAGAIPPEKSDEELMRDSDVVAVVRVLGVACTDVSKEGPGTYQAWLQVISVSKGPVRPSDTVLVSWQDNIPMPGDWRPAYHPGEVVLTHLAWHEEARCYETSWWNAKRNPSGRPGGPLGPLPDRPGRVLIAGHGAIEPLPGAPRYMLGVFTEPVPAQEDPRRGVRITRVIPDSPADWGGLKVGDLILEANGVAIASPQDLSRAVDRSAGALRLRIRSGRPPFRETPDAYVPLRGPRPEKVDEPRPPAPGRTEPQ